MKTEKREKGIKLIKRITERGVDKVGLREKWVN